MIKDYGKQKKYQFIGLLLIAFGLFINLYFLREQAIVNLFHTERVYLWAINVPACLGIFLIALTQPLSINFKRVDTYAFLLIFLSIIPLFVSTLANGKTIGYAITTFILVVFPLILLFFKIDEETLYKFIPILLIILNVLLCIVAVGGLIDFFFQKAHIKWLASFMTHHKMFDAFTRYDSDETSRYMSILGHPLLTTFVCNTIYALNVACRKLKFKGTLPSFIVFIPTLIVSVCTASKTGIVVTAVITLIAYYKNLWLMGGIVLGSLILYFVGFFDFIIYRFMTGSLSSNRFSSLHGLLNDKLIPLPILFGYGGPDLASSYIAALEFPSVILSYSYGLIFAILVLIVPFVYMTYKLCRKGTFEIYLLWLILFAQVNTYPTLGQGYDHPYIFYFISFLLLTISQCKQKRN